MVMTHNADPQPFRSKVLATHRGCLPRFIDESLRIENEQMSLTNSKGEWGAGQLVRLNPNRPNTGNVSQRNSRSSQVQTQAQNHSNANSDNRQLQTGSLSLDDEPNHLSQLTGTTEVQTSSQRRYETRSRGPDNSNLDG